MHLGKKIRDLRFRRGLTVQQLAELSALSKGFISQVENERTSPSLATLKDLARALNTSVAWLVGEEDAAPHVVRESERRSGNGTPIHVEVLTAQPRRNLELLMTTIPPGGNTRTERDYHHGEECIVCLDGHVVVLDGDQRIELKPGDSCHFDRRAARSIENAGSAAARVLVAITPASFEPATRAKPVAEADPISAV